MTEVKVLAPPTDWAVVRSTQQTEVQLVPPLATDKVPELRLPEASEETAPVPRVVMSTLPVPLGVSERPTLASVPLADRTGLRVVALPVRVTPFTAEALLATDTALLAIPEGWRVRVPALLTKLLIKTEVALPVP